MLSSTIIGRYVSNIKKKKNYDLRLNSYFEIVLVVHLCCYRVYQKPANRKIHLFSFSLPPYPSPPYLPYTGSELSNFPLIFTPPPSYHGFDKQSISIQPVWPRLSCHSPPTIVFRHHTGNIIHVLHCSFDGPTLPSAVHPPAALTPSTLTE